MRVANERLRECKAEGSDRRTPRLCPRVWETHSFPVLDYRAHFKLKESHFICTMSVKVNETSPIVASTSSSSNGLAVVEALIAELRATHRFHKAEPSSSSLAHSANTIEAIATRGVNEANAGAGSGAKNWRNVEITSGVGFLKALPQSSANWAAQRSDNSLGCFNGGMFPLMERYVLCASASHFGARPTPCMWAEGESVQ